MSEKLCLQWNDFKENITASFENLRHDEDFADVTLACEDGKQVEAHKVVLASSSPVFQKILKRNKHAHPLIYMRGMRSEDVSAVLDFLYCGETNVYQEDLDYFLTIAEELELKGLMGNSNQGEQAIPSEPSEASVAKDAALKEETKKTKSTTMSYPRGLSRHSQVRTVSLASEHSADIQKLDEQINSLMIKSSRKNIRGMPIYVCNDCGKEGHHSQVRDHIERDHLEGISIPCNFCEKIFSSRNSKTKHITRRHKGQQDLL